MIKAKINGLNDLFRNVQHLKGASEKATVSALAQVAIDVANDARDNHTFTNRTGNLEGSIQPLPVEMKGRRFIQKVRAGMSYAYYVEFGTEKTNAYPFMNPALNRNATNQTDTLKAANQAAIKEVCK